MTIEIKWPDRGGPMWPLCLKRTVVSSISLYSWAIVLGLDIGQLCNGDVLHVSPESVNVQNQAQLYLLFFFIKLSSRLPLFFLIKYLKAFLRNILIIMLSYYAESKTSLSYYF